MTVLAMIILIAASLIMAIPVAMGFRKHTDLRHVDGMAGDEGED